MSVRKKTKKAKKKKGLRAFVEYFAEEEIPETTPQAALERRATGFLILLGDVGREEAKKEFGLTRREASLSYD